MMIWGRTYAERNQRLKDQRHYHHLGICWGIHVIGDGRVVWMADLDGIKYSDGGDYYYRLHVPGTERLK